MKTKRYFFGLPAVLLAVSASLTLSLALTGCGGDEDNPEPGDPITGLPTVTGEDIYVPGEGMPVSYDGVPGDNGESFTITGGKLSFTLPPDPTNAQPLSANEKVQSMLFGNSDPATANPGDAAFVIVDGFPFGNGGKNWLISKEETTGDLFTSGSVTVSKIVYVYADQDVTLSRAAQDWTTGGENPIDYQWGAVNLALKQGWSLVRLDLQATVTDSTITVKATVAIATTDDVPWTIREDV
jgi:hypothetical protein